MKKDDSKIRRTGSNEKMPLSENYVKLLVTTEDYLITGKLRLPIPGVVENPTTENLLFYALNCGNMFMALHECIISNRHNIEYQPEHVDYFNINLNIVHSCQILKD